MHAPLLFQRMIDQRLGDLSFVCVYLEDLVVFSKSLDDQVHHLDLVVGLRSHHWLEGKIYMCYFAQEKLALHGHIVSDRGVEVEPEKLKIIHEIPVPKNARELRSFLEISGHTIDAF